MSATTVETTPGWGGTETGFGAGPGIPLTRLVRVELRKMVDTRAGLWLLGVIGLITAAALVVLLLAANTDQHTFVNSMGAASAPQGLLLPVLGILLVTQEWGQRTGMVTFTLVPHRGRTLLAKVVAAVLLGLAAIVLAFVLAALATAVGGADDAWQGVSAGVLGQYVLIEVIGVLGGLVFGLLFLNTAAAIVVSFALPIVFNLVTTLWSAAKDAQPWIDPSTAQGPLAEGDLLSSAQWQHLLTTTLIWVVVPLALGVWRVLRAEVK